MNFLLLSLFLTLKPLVTLIFLSITIKASHTGTNAFLHFK